MLDSSPSNGEATPKKTRKPRAPNGSNVRTDNSDSKIRATLKLLFGTAVTFTRFANANDAELIAYHSGLKVIDGETGNLIDAIVELSKQDKGVRAFLLSIGETSAWGNVAMAALPLVIAILANHGLIPNLFAKPNADATY